MTVDENSSHIIIDKPQTCLCRKHIMTTDNENISLLFNLFDKDKDGHISQAELIEILQELQTPHNVIEIGNLFKEADTNRDGKMEYFEFVNYFLV